MAIWGIHSPAVPMIWASFLYSSAGTLSILLAIWEAGDRALDEQEKIPLNNEESFDFIVVGAGSSGSVVANRLSKMYSVLLLESGGEPHPLQFIPGIAMALINNPQLDWQHKTVPQKYSSLNSVNQQSSWSAGKGLGGTGNLNIMIHLRGHTKDFDNWANLTGDPSWSWEGVLPYFKSYEDYYDQKGDNSKYHGFGGPLRVGLPDFVGMGPDFVKAGEELGYPITDLNAPFDEGFDVIKYPTKNGAREAPYKAFIQPIRTRETLTIRKFSHVTRVLFKDDNVAYGVEYDRHGERRIAVATKEVILSAGAITTPRILMLSGIGPLAHLQELGIPIRQNLPVGQELQDHTAVYLGPFFINKPKTVVVERDFTPRTIVQWFTRGRGILSSTGCHATGIFSSTQAKARGEGNWPDIVVFLLGYSVFSNFGASFARAFGLKLDEQEKYFKHAVGKENFMLVVMGGRPFSRGYLKLGGTSPYDSLVIDPNYLSDPGDVDLKVLLDGVKRTLELAENTTTLGVNMNARFTQEKLPGCEHLVFRSEAYWECYTRRYTVTLHHPVGTCGMGRVVDTKLRVLGTKNLRVIDSSIQPVVVTTNTQASALMIGEKGADIVLKHWEESEIQNLLNKY